MQTGFDLPPPEAGAREHSDRVRELVAARIAAGGGFLSFADYMDAVLYAPGLGYYSAGAQKFGAAGDFVTAPELGSVFARCLARLAGAALRQLGGGVILEVGGGSGALAADLLLALRDAPPERYLLLDVSGDLRDRQRRTIEARVPELLHRVTWLDALPADALAGRAPRQRGAGCPAGRALPDRPGPAGAARRPDCGGRPRVGRTAGAGAACRGDQESRGAARRAAAPRATPSEIGLRHATWLRALLASLSRGLALCIDYGGTRREIYHPGRRDGTLVCHYRHRQHADPFFLPGTPGPDGLGRLLGGGERRRGARLRRRCLRHPGPRAAGVRHPGRAAGGRGRGRSRPPARGAGGPAPAPARRDGRALQGAGAGARVHARSFP